jgi:hypothetical protein
MIQLTKKQVLDLLGISPKTLGRRMASGRYKYTRNGEGRYTTRIVSRLALCLSTGISLSMTADACHIPKCPSRACCNPRHLFWGTHQKNCSMRESRDARWERYINAMAAAAATDKGIFVVFEKRYKMGWGWLDCRSVQSTASTLSHSYAKPIEDAAALVAIA